MKITKTTCLLFLLAIMGCISERPWGWTVLGHETQHQLNYQTLGQIPCPDKEPSKLPPLGTFTLQMTIHITEDYSTWPPDAALHKANGCATTAGEVWLLQRNWKE